MGDDAVSESEMLFAIGGKANVEVAVMDTSSAEVEEVFFASETPHRGAFIGGEFCDFTPFLEVHGEGLVGFIGLPEF